MHILAQLLLIPLAYGFFKLGRFLIRIWRSPLNNLPGPKSSSWLFGNLSEVFKADNAVMHEKWVSQFGKTLKYYIFLGAPRLLVADTKAVNHILMNAYDYPKPEINRVGLGRILGPGILVVEGNQHKLQRKIMNPAFALSNIREMLPIFFEKSVLLRDLWMSEIAQSQDSVDVLSWLGKLTLDIIGIAGFGYHFDALNPSKKPNELNEAFNKVFSSTTTGASLLSNPLRLLKVFIPALRIFKSQEDRDVDAARATMDRIGLKLVNDAKAFWQASGDNTGLQAKDLLSLLIKANMGKDVPESQRLNDFDVLAQVPAFLTAGHETTSTSVTWALFALSQNKEAQSKLREELLTVQSEAPDLDELNSLTYLDYVVRETLRLHSPVPATIRQAAKDDVIPLNEPYVDSNGVTQDTLPISKGDSIFVSITLMHRDKSVWGEDSFEFRPERWAELPDSVRSIPGVYSNILTFLNGPRSCIGYRFALAEMKAILFTIVRSFEFDLAVPLEDIGSKSMIVQRPFLKSDPKAGSKMPLNIRLYQA